MKKLVVLKFDGNFESGFQVNLEIANEGQRAYRTTTAKLPENISIPQLLNNWHEIYCSRYSQFRVKSGGSRRVNLESLNQECTRESINLLASFNEWLNASSFTSILNSLQELNPKDEIRIIITTSCHELRQLPWHLWDILIKFPLLEVALSSPNAERGERVLRDKIRILIILGDSSNIDIEADKKLLHNFCGDDAEIVLLKQPSREELNRYLQDDLGWDILFFSGHSQTQNPTPNPLPASEEGANKMMQGRIYLNNHDSLTMGELRDALQVAIQRRLQIAFFNSCDGLGIAYELEKLHIPQVIVMREPVPDKVAQEFLKYFLQEFTGGKSLYIAVKNARLELQQLESEFPCASWLPIIIQNQTETPPTWQSLGIISFCPYQGLSAFKEENAEYFFGRDKATASLVTAVNSKPLVAVVGASGSGKSSLVFAGLIPQLRGDNNWLILSFRPGKNPFAALAVALVSALNLPENERRLAELELDVNLKSDSVALENFIKNLTPLPPFPTREGGNKNVLLSSGSRGGVTRILLIADQFEEIYTLCTDAEERKIFLDGLLQAVNNAPFFTLLLTLRADFLSRVLDDYEPFGRALQQYQLEPVVRMNRKELEAAITLPAKQLGFEFEEGLCNTIIDDIEDGDGRLPLLEFTLTQLWKQQYAGMLTHQAYKKIGGVEQALANYADMVYADLSEGERETAQRVLIQLVQPGEGTEDTRKLATREEVGGDNWDLVTRLADKRLVVTNWDELRNEETVEVVHEALIRHWGRLRGWMQENREIIKQKLKIEIAAKEWEENGKSKDYLLRGKALKNAKIFIKRQKESLSLSKKAQMFLHKSIGRGKFSLLVLITILIFSFPYAAFLLMLSMVNFPEFISSIKIDISRDISIQQARQILNTTIGQKSNPKRLEAFRVILQYKEYLKEDLWRENWSNENLISLDFSHVRMGSTIFQKSDIRDSNFTNAALVSANFSNANMKGTQLKSANLELANFTNTNLIYTNFSHANLRKAKLKNSDLRKANMYCTNLIDADLTKANLQDIRIERILYSNKTKFPYRYKNNLLSPSQNNYLISPNSNLENAKLTYAELPNVQLNNANLAGANLANVNLAGANLAGANLTNANLFGANLASANLTNVDLTNADLTNAHLFGANLGNVKLNGTDLMRTNFRGAKHMNLKQLSLAKNWKYADYDENVGKALLDSFSIKSPVLKIQEYSVSVQEPKAECYADIKNTGERPLELPPVQASPSLNITPLVP